MANKKTLCVVGASGLVGSSIVKEALSRGYKVNGTLRNPDDLKKITFLQKLKNAQNLTIFSSNMSDKKSLMLPIERSDAVFICCLIPTYKGFDGTPARDLNYKRGYNEIINPTLIGCLNILEVVRISGIKKVIICSSTSSTNPFPSVSIKNEDDHWSDESIQCKEKKYTSAAKTVMEKAAIKFCEENLIRLSIILPTGLYGQAIMPEHMNHSPFSWLNELIKGGEGRHKKIPNDSTSMIHLADLANLFLAAYENPEASGRYYGVYKSLHWQDIYSECQKILPDMVMPEPLSEKLIQPTQFDFTRRDSLGVKIRDFPTLLKQTIDWIKSKPF